LKLRQIQSDLSYAVGMKFRQKFGWLGWISLGMICLTTEEIIRSRDFDLRALSVVSLLSWMFVLSTQVTAIAFIYFRVENEGLFYRRFRKTRFLRWDELTRVWSSGNYMPWMKSIQIEYLERTPEIHIGNLAIQPKNYDGLVRALRDHALQAKVDL